MPTARLVRRARSPSRFIATQPRGRIERVKSAAQISVSHDSITMLSDCKLKRTADFQNMGCNGTTRSTLCKALATNNLHRTRRSFAMSRSLFLFSLPGERRYSITIVKNKESETRIAKTAAIKKNWFNQENDQFVGLQQHIIPSSTLS